MHDLANVLIALTGVVIVPVLAVAGIAGLTIWLWHRGKITKLQMEEKERQAEMDRELLGLGSAGISAHLQTILHRLNTVEERLNRIEGLPQTTSSGGATRIPITSAEDATQRRERRERERA